MKRFIKHIAILVFVLSFKHSWTQQYTSKEIKAAFLCNFAKFTQWPDSKFENITSPIVIGLVGEHTFGDAIYNIAKEAKVGNRTVVVKSFNNIKEATDAHIVYLGKADKTTISDSDINYIHTHNLLMVAENPSACEKGGMMICFSNSESTYGFNININSSKKANLTISAKLLKLAKIVN